MKATKLRSDIMTASRDEFEVLIKGVAEDLLPNFARAWRLGERDKLGIDLFQYDPATGAETLAVQAKTVEREIKPRHIKPLCKEVAKYQRLGPPVQEYWLVINKPLKVASERAEIEAALAQLVASGKAKVARLLDQEQFIKHLGQLAQARIVEWSTAFQSTLRDEYARRLQVVAYIGEVPFRSSIEARAPADWVIDRSAAFLQSAHENQAGENRKPPRFLLASSFGFGKTSTLHAVADRWIASGKHAIYVPAARLPQRAFANGAGLVDGLLQAIAPPDIDQSTQVWRLLRSVLKDELSRSRDWILLIDAIDESPHWASQNHLSALWAGVAALGVPTVVSVREEVYASRRLEFSHAGMHNEGVDFFEHFELLDWTGDLIGQFLDLYAAQRPEAPPAAFIRFQDAVRIGAYEKLYGDIPRRPLFLSMLAGDAWNGAEPERDLARLYEKYFRDKLLNDWFSPGAGGAPVRANSITERHGYEETIERMLLGMEDVAAAMAEEADANLPRGVIAAPQLEQCLRPRLGDYVRPEEVLLISVLKPAGRHPLDRSQLFSFAHQSFFDWFLARSRFRGASEFVSEEIGDGAVGQFMRTMRIAAADASR
jgi:hypothetical protein